MKKGVNVYKTQKAAENCIYHLTEKAQALKQDKVPTMQGSTKR